MTVFGRAYPRMVGMLRERSWMLWEIILPILGVSAYVFIYRAIGAPEIYIGFVVMGGAMTAFWLNVLWSMSSQLYWEKEMGNLSLYIMAPNSMMGILLGMAVGGLFFAGQRALVITIVGSWIFGVSYEVVSYWQLFAVFMLTMVALYGLGMMTSSLFLLLSREAWHLANLAQEPIYLASGFYFPVKNLTFWVAAGASIIPLTMGMDAMRQLVFPDGSSLGFLSVDIEIAILVGLSVLFVVGAKLMLDYMERLAIREGRLTESKR
ncbi:MAG: ABC transporter permease [Chloroflexi bacterium]|nr:MAG: ABC transporter permease [Chloroflexota bacterium]MBL1196771.1 ABC transporter permease [Chloroflexota bacterium]NOH14065.1 ABC transporter permease [Chloroflexota bacterium]